MGWIDAEPDVIAGRAVSRRPDAAWVTVDSAVVVHDARRDVVHRLDPLAGRCWQLLQGETTPTALARALSGPLSLAAAAEACSRGLAALEARQLLTTRLLPGPVAAAAASTLDDPVGTAPSHSLGPYAALGHRFAVDCDHPSLGGELAVALAPLSCDVAPEHVYRVRADGSAITLRVGHHQVARVRRPTQLVAAMVTSLRDSAVASMAHTAVLRASAVCLAGRVLLFVGSAGASTASALVREGARALADDAVALDPETGEILPFANHASGGTAVAARPHAVFLTRQVAGQPTRLARLGPAEALVRLVTHWFPSPLHRQRALDVLAATVEDRPCYDLRSPDGAATAEAIVAMGDRSPEAFATAGWHIAVSCPR